MKTVVGSPNSGEAAMFRAVRMAGECRWLLADLADQSLASRGLGQAAGVGRTQPGGLVDEEVAAMRQALQANRVLHGRRTYHDDGLGLLIRSASAGSACKRPEAPRRPRGVAGAGLVQVADRHDLQLGQVGQAGMDAVAGMSAAPNQAHADWRRLARSRWSLRFALAPAIACGSFRGGISYAKAFRPALARPGMYELK